MAFSLPFLTAEWRNILMLNYEVDPAILLPYIPAGTELELWDGKALVSMVGFMFNKTRVLRIAPPFHTRFEEINLRFYVQRIVDGETRHGVVFIKEIVPRFWVARMARVLYGENYIALPTRHTIEKLPEKPGAEGLVEFSWRYKGRRSRLGGLAVGQAQEIRPGSSEEFITQHYWGYTRLGPQTSGEYRVEHPGWCIRQVAQPYLLCDVDKLYGKELEPFLRRRPYSAFLADGSAVTIYMGKRFHSSGEKSK